MRPHKDSSASVPDTLAASSTPVFYGWWIVGATMLSLIVGIGPIIGLTFGVFLKPLIEEFGWSRGQAAQGVSLALLGFALAQPLIGRLMVAMTQSGSFYLVPELCMVATLLATGLIASLRKHTAPSLDLT